MVGPFLFIRANLNWTISSQKRLPMTSQLFILQPVPNPSDVPMFVLDLNVYFDLVRNRDHSENARRLFGKALGHTVHLAGC